MLLMKAIITYTDLPGWGWTSTKNIFVCRPGGYGTHVRSSHVSSRGGMSGFSLVFVEVDVLLFTLQYI